MTDLVQNGEHSGHEIALVEPQHQPAISRADGGAGGVDSQIKPTSAAVETSGDRHRFTEAPLLVYRERSPRNRRENWTLGNLLCELNQTLPHCPEEPSHDPAVDPGLVVFDERIVRLTRVANALRLVPL